MRSDTDVNPNALPARVIEAGPGDRTALIQTALDETSAAGGGTVVLGAGVHLAGGLRLRSHVAIKLEEGAILRAATGYDSFAGNESSVIAEDSDRAFLLGLGVAGVRLLGPGTIDGQGPAWTLGPDGDMGVMIPAHKRPRTLVIENGSDIEIAGLHVLRSPMWTLHLVACDRVRVIDTVVKNDLNHPNTDGIVVDSCHDVEIINCRVHAADDGIVLKTSRSKTSAEARSCARVRVTGTEVRSMSCALKLGTESFGDFEDIRFEDCRVVGSNRALGIFSRDGGAVTGVSFRRVTVECHETPDGFWGSGEAVTINVIDRRRDLRPAGSVRDVVIEDVSGSMEGAINLVGQGAGRISGVVLCRVHLEQREGALGTGKCRDLRPTPADLAPAPNAAGRANAWVMGANGRVVGLHPYPGGLPGIYAENIDGLVVEDVEITRPSALPEEWNAEPVVIVQTA